MPRVPSAPPTLRRIFYLLSGAATPKMGGGCFGALNRGGPAAASARRIRRRGRDGEGTAGGPLTAPIRPLPCIRDDGGDYRRRDAWEPPRGYRPENPWDKVKVFLSNHGPCAPRQQGAPAAVQPPLRGLLFSSSSSPSPFGGRSNISNLISDAARRHRTTWGGAVATPRRSMVSSVSDGSSSSSSSSSSSNSNNKDEDESENPDMAGLFKNPIVQQLWKARQQAKALEAARKAGQKRKPGASSASQPKRQPPQPPKGKSPKDSEVSVTYRFSTDTFLREAYRNPWGQMRLGRLMEDLDALAGNIAYFHVSSNSSSSSSEQGAAGAEPTSADAQAGVEEEEDEEQHHQPPIIVTASVDRIKLKRPSPDMTRDQELSGCVTWTGTSSMEIRMQSQVKGETEPWLVAYVTFVTLHPTTKRPMPISPVLPSTPAEQERYDAGARRAALKKMRRQRKRGPAAPQGGGDLGANELEDLAESLLREAGPLLTLPSLADPHSILMGQTKMQNAQIAQPQVQNLHRRIFGGFLLRRAFELGFANAYLFGGALPLFLEVDEVSFQSPVDVGDLLVFNSRVLYTEPDGADLGTYYVQQKDRSSSASASSTHPPMKLPIVHVEVECWVTEPERAQARLSNQFYFTFAVRSSSEATAAATKTDVLMGEADAKTPSTPPLPPIRKVLPSNIDEARRMAARILGDREQHRAPHH